jgi:peptide deformylase
MSIRLIVQKGHRSLKANNKTVKDISSLKIKQVIKDLKDTIKKETLIGIAAPQIAENFRIFITYPRGTKYRSLGKNDKLRVFINPKIVFISNEMSTIYEGCGSVTENKQVPFGPVLRPRVIGVKALDEKGRLFYFECDGILARVIQHEMDHLNGIEFLDHIKNKKNVVSEKYYKKNLKKSKKQLDASIITKIRFEFL